MTTDSQKKDNGSNDYKLPNSSAGFSGAAQAEYFSKARYHLESDVSNLIVNHKQQLDELQLLKMIKGQE